MTTTPRALVLLALSACIDEQVDSDLDDAITEDEAGKADEVQAYKHYVLVAGEPGEQLSGRYLARAGGGKLRCPDDIVRERCEVTDSDLVPTLGLNANPTVVIDELETTSMIARGRLVRTGDGRVYLRMSALTRSLTTVMPAPGTICFRLAPAAHTHSITKLDTTTVTKVRTLYWDYVDPTPDSWGQPTPAVQAQIDRALALSSTRPVYTCGSIDKRDTGDLYWAEQVFAPN